MTRKQQAIVTQLREAFRGVADTFEVVEQEKRVLVFMSHVTANCQNRLHNQFAVGLRGGLKVIEQEFNALV